MSLPPSIEREWKERDNWAKNIASDCPEMYDKYVGIPAPKPACKLTDEPCEFENCPKRVKKEHQRNE